MHWVLDFTLFLEATPSLQFDFNLYELIITQQTQEKQLNLVEWRK